jgi:hypothetical protein
MMMLILADMSKSGHVALLLVLLLLLFFYIYLGGAFGLNSIRASVGPL